MRFFRMDLRVRFTAADPTAVLNRLAAAGVQIQDILWLDSLTVSFALPVWNYQNAKKYFDKHGISYRIIRKYGILWRMLSIMVRPVLLCGISAFLLLAYAASGRIFFVKVIGNDQVPKEQILCHAYASGIMFGAKSEDVRSEVTKNKLLGELPELQWVGVTTSGCVATVQVKERAKSNQIAGVDSRISHLVAGQSGVITKVVVSQGNALISAGQAVQKGDVLISGYTDCGRVIKAERADGEIFALTKHVIQALSPSAEKIRGESHGEHTCYKLCIGKKVINFCNHSGIRDATCVKMYLEDYWSLPGNFRLPVALIKERYLYCPSISNPWMVDTFGWFPAVLREQLLRQLVAGEILDEALRFENAEGVCRLFGEYACHEMIGRVKCEEIVERYAEDN